MRVRAASKESLAWLEVRSGAILTRHATGVEAVDACDNVRGVVGFDDACPGSIRAHMAVDAPIAWRTLLPAALEYAFEQLHKRVLLGTIRASNGRSLAFATRAGLVETYRLRDGWAHGEDLVVVEMRQEAWLQRKKGRQTSWVNQQAQRQTSEEPPKMRRKAHDKQSISRLSPIARARRRRLLARSGPKGLMAPGNKTPVSPEG